LGVQTRHHFSQDPYNLGPLNLFFDVEFALL